jgi:hypothetical protein
MLSSPRALRPTPQGLDMARADLSCLASVLLPISVLYKYLGCGVGVSDTVTGAVHNTGQPHLGSSSQAPVLIHLPSLQ